MSAKSQSFSRCPRQQLTAYQQAIPPTFLRLTSQSAKTDNSGTACSTGFLAGLGTGFIGTTALFLFFGWCLTSSMAHAVQPTDDPSEQVSEKPRQRSVREIRKDIDAFVKNSKQKKDLSLQVGSVLDLCQLHHELVNDPRFHVGTQFKSFRARVATRLRSYKKELEVELKRRKRAEERAARLAAQAARRLDGSDTPMAAAESSPPESKDQSTNQDEWDQLLNRSMYEMGSVSGGPSELFGYLGGSYAPPWDYGEDLVQLIERTISPETWLRNGGNGRIQYYRPSMVIVVSASTQVHDQMTDLLRQMRFLSR